MSKQLKMIWSLMILAAILGLGAQPFAHLMNALVEVSPLFYLSVFSAISVVLFLAALGIGFAFVSSKKIKDIQFGVFFGFSFLVGGITLFWIVFTMIHWTQ
ncbi:hypothetical protein FPQ10_06460 [Allobacillus sp. SKP2-8]|uniref:hypothetical protein n=1 Tax=unclassified Allobacillus TaxID=2628859 RepID=UPI0011840884|nr:hypothetical protein [Allobacillus sp. SKP2-8]TSJ66898.1 hypothetical protein FPQ10_06460 [Allobacillus sp. SKP2-8]